MAISDEMSAILPEDERVKLSSGTFVLLESLKMRQFFRLMRIVTHGAGPAIARMNFDVNGSAEEFTQQLVTLILFAIPDAEDETVDFLMSMVKPDGLIENRALNKADKERNSELIENLRKELDNPEPEDFVTLIESIVKREAGDLQALGKRVVKMFQTAQKVGVAPSLTSPAVSSSEESPEPVISSPTSTVGLTSTSSNSHSDESVSVLRPSTNESTTSVSTNLL